MATDPARDPDTQTLRAYARGEIRDPQKLSWIEERIDESAQVLRRFLAIVEEADEIPFPTRLKTAEGTPSQADVPTKPIDDTHAAPSATVTEGFPEWLEGHKYRRDQTLGRGGMGTVFRYRDTRLDRLVAVKSVPIERSHDAEWRKRLWLEAKLVASLNHTNIAKIYDLVEHDGGDYLILEYVPGRSLTQEFARDRFSIERAIDTAAQLADAIAAGHSRQIVHGDIKPGNIMITPDSQVKLLDYGLAERSGSLDSDDHQFSAERIAHGTPGYMSPERERGELVDERSDVWAFGCVLYECLTGRPAFDPERRVVWGREGSRPDWSLLPNRTPRSVRRLLERCLEPKHEQRLADVNEARRILRSLVGSARTDPRGIPNNLPVRLASFVSRTGEIERLRSFLETTPLLTLVGPGGAGKTRLATEIALDVVTEDNLRQSPRYPNGVWFVNLETLTESGLVAQAVATTLGIADVPRDQPMASMVDVVVEHLRGAATMLVLDNCEHVLHGCQELVKTLHAKCPGVSVLATSRESLSVSGEQTYPVPALSFPDDAAHDVDDYESVRLFVLRAKMADPGFVVTDQNRPWIAQICRQLEGLPFAIELAAARVRMGVEAVASRLFEVMDRQALESSIEMSVRLLTRSERTLLSRLSVFRGGWTLETAEKICCDGRADEEGTIGRRPVVRLLGQLADRSLVNYEERGDRARYHLLETVRAYSADKLLDTSDVEWLRLRHVEVFTDLAEQADRNFSGEHAAAWLDRLESEHDNLRTALDWSQRDQVDPLTGVRLVTAMQVFWVVRGYAAEGGAWIDNAINRRSGERDLWQMRALNAGGTVAGRLGDFDKARAMYVEALKIGRELDDRPRLAGVNTNLGLLALECGELEGAQAYHQEALALSREIGSDEGVARARLNLMDVAAREGRYDDARRLAEECLPVFKSLGASVWIAATQLSIGRLAIREARLSESRTALLDCLSIVAAVGDRHVAAEAAGWLAVVSQRLGEIARGCWLLTASEVLGRDYGESVTWMQAPGYLEAAAALRDEAGEATLSVLARDVAAMTWGQIVNECLAKGTDGGIDDSG